MMLPRDRLAYSSPFTRPPLKLPGNGRMIVWTVVNVEEWEITRPMARQLSQPPMGDRRRSPICRTGPGTNTECGSGSGG